MQELKAANVGFAPGDHPVHATLARIEHSLGLPNHLPYVRNLTAGKDSVFARWLSAVHMRQFAEAVEIMCIRRVCPFDKVHPLLQSDQGQHARLVMNLRVRYGHLWVCVGEVRRPSPRLVSNPRLAAVLRQAEGPTFTFSDALYEELHSDILEIPLGHGLLVDRTMGSPRSSGKSLSWFQVHKGGCGTPRSMTPSSADTQREASLV